MNYFAHGRCWVHNPYFLAGTAVPDWLSVADRRTRVRSKHAGQAMGHSDQRIAAVAAGVVQHCADDQWFHGTRRFAELSLELAVLARSVLPGDDGFRPHFLGHILVEILLDAALIEDRPDLLDAYYRAVDQIENAAVEAAVNAMAPHRTDRLAAFIPLFSRQRFLYDYADDERLLIRLNQIMRRVRLPALPIDLREILPAARKRVYPSKDELLDCPSATSTLTR